jgi:hypothetical protein
MPNKNKNTTTTAGTTLRNWRITVALRGLFGLLTKHYSMHTPVHVGMFAGSLLQRGDWDH